MKRFGVLFVGVLLILASIWCLSGVSSTVAAVKTILVSEKVVSGNPDADEGATHNAAATLPELVSPLPLPEWHKPAGVRQPEDQIVAYNVASKQERLIGLPLKKSGGP